MRVAVITGASGGIGKTLVFRLAQMGMNLVLVGRSEEKLLAVQARAEQILAGAPEAPALAAEGTLSGGTDLSADKGTPRTVICCGNLTRTEFAGEIMETARREFGGLDVLINCAGMAQHDAFEEVTTEQFDRIMAINVRAPFFLCQKALGLLRASECATIINICSVVAHKGYPQQSVYAASKHALLGLSKSLANEVFRENIRVHVISPGAVFTDMIALARPDLTPEGMTLPEDIADIVAFLLTHRRANAVIDEIQVHRGNKEPFL